MTHTQHHAPAKTHKGNGGKSSLPKVGSVVICYIPPDLKPHAAIVTGVNDDDTVDLALTETNRPKIRYADTIEHGTKELTPFCVLPE